MTTPATSTNPATLDPGQGDVALDIQPIELGQTIPEPQPAPAASAVVATETLREPPSTIPAPRLDENATLRRELAQIRAEQAAQESTAALTREARTVQQEAIARGLSDEDALWAAQRYYNLALRVNQERQQIRADQQLAQDKQAAAAWVAKEYGVDQSLLMTGNSGEEMVAIAQREQRYAAQEKRIQTLEQGRVQPQRLNAPNGSRAGSITVSTDNIDKVWYDYETEHPGQPNPYEDIYRKFLFGE